jgi:hypothetical protein
LNKIPDYEERLDQLFDLAFSFKTNHPCMLDWIKVKFELRDLRDKVIELTK